MRKSEIKNQFKVFMKYRNYAKSTSDQYYSALCKFLDSINDTPENISTKEIIEYLSFRNGNTNTAYVNNTNTGWFYLFIVYDGAKPEADRVELYIDGVKQTLIVSGTTPTSLASNAGSQLKVGSLGNSFFTDGNFGHFLIKTGVSAGLTEAQAIASGTQDPSVVIPSPEIYLPFDGNTNNLGTSGINGTANNNPTYTPEP